MMNSAARSFTDPPGLRNSALPRIVQPVISDARRSFISGVLPIESIKPLRISMFYSRAISHSRFPDRNIGREERRGKTALYRPAFRHARHVIEKHVHIRRREIPG